MSRIRRIARATLANLGVSHWLMRYIEWRKSRTDDPPPKADEDGVPMPTSYLMYLIGGTTDWRFFLRNGEAAAREFADRVDRNGGDFRGAGRILDFGCGCGRIARHLPKFTDAEIFGVDYNSRLIKWCAANLTGTYSQNRLNPPLGFEDGFFDIVYLYSVFTHLRIETQKRWLEEFARVIRPGGTALVTFHDEDHDGLNVVGVSRERLIEEKTLIQKGVPEGSNFIATFQSRDFTQRLFGEIFDVCEIVASNQTLAGQAIAVLRRRLSPAPSPA